ncbi:hypothetical protein B0H63DRAFT_442012 [Podospora didyma]|uniref:Peptidase S8/S53 domain-containing protein n=1 Tax=Podospora didyma TaxID=330526 RepID=A0AAE0K270_9PEZI|nr:hypothetical protein B0H63DRAFT_442012 [Podospora didyma]
MAQDIGFSFVADEIVAPGTDLVIKIARPFHARVAQDAISLRRGGNTVPTPVKVSKADGTVTLSTKALSRGRYYELAVDKAVGKVFLDDSSSVPDLVDSETVARAIEAQNLGFKGKGVHVAVFENGPIDLSKLEFAGRYTSSPSASDLENHHSRLTNAIIKNKDSPDKPHGYAPDCDLYSANSRNNAALLSPHGDRELPEIAANGTGVSTIGETNSGTSFAAPAVAGTAALIQSVDGSLKTWPEACRAVLFASADRNISGGTWAQDLVAKVDASDGAGALNAQLAVLIAQTRANRDNTALVRGWDAGSLVTANFDTNTQLSTFKYRIQVPSSALNLKYTVKVALAWDSKVALNAAGTATASTLTNDLDLIVMDSSGMWVGSSSSFDNSYEIVEFTGTKGAAYDIVVRSWTWPWQAEISYLWYGIAWNVTSRLNILAPGLVEEQI